MLPVPDVTNLDIAFGNISWLPKWEDIPDDFKKYGHTKECGLVSKWFFGGLTEQDFNKLKPKAGVDKNKALMACKACLVSFEPKHEHKEAGVAFMLNQWFQF